MGLRHGGSTESGDADLTDTHEGLEDWWAHQGSNLGPAD
jgi:hypothetical protein